MKKIAIIGSGISGLSVAYLLNQKYDVTLFEADHRLGGHTNTIQTPDTPVDTGFIVFNQNNYPNFCKFIAQLNVESIESNMSFAYFNQTKNNGYSSDFPKGLFSSPKNIISPSFYRFLYQITQFNRKAKASVFALDENQTIIQYLKNHRYSQRLIDEYVMPMGAAIWSTSQNDMHQFPAKSFISFWENHSLLQLFNRPKWRTIVGGSKTYIHALIKKINLTYFVNHPIYQVKRTSKSVTLLGPNGPMEYDAVVIATHADQALKMLEAPSQLETQTLGKWRYSKNNTVLHTSPIGLPKKRSGWASWIYTRHNDDQMSATYWMNRLQRLSSKTDYFVSLNSHQNIPNDERIYSTTYEHPMMTRNAMKTQTQLANLNGYLNTYFCGSYFGNGFHEDGIASSVEVGKLFGCHL